MGYIWIAIAFIFGFIAKQINLPPLVGYLLAGFFLHALGMTPDATLTTLADFGVALLLFTIGLKLNIKNLFKTEIWLGALGHMGLIVLITTLNSLLLAYLGVVYFEALQWQAAALLGFSISFSSTVCAVKMLEEQGEMQARHGQVAIGILIIQDIAAVLFITLATDKSPSIWALGLLALPLVKPMFYKLIQYCGHGEVLPLAGFFLAFTGAETFELVGLEAHLGALVFGALLSGSNKAVEMAKSLLGFKDLFLIGFFLSVGFTALPTLEMFGIALLIALALPLKAGLFFIWLTRLKLRSRTAFLSCLSLANYSEFGLIVCSISVTHQLLAKEWLVILSLAVTLSFIFSSIINVNAHKFYQHWHEFIKRFETSERLAEDRFSLPHKASILVIGMGRVGGGAYDTLRNEHQKRVCGIDVDKERVIAQCNAGRNVINADAEDPDFWAHTNFTPIHLIMFALPNHLDILEAVRQLRLAGYQGNTASVARFQDEETELRAAGIDVVFNYYAKVGAGFADETVYLFDTNNSKISSSS
jgi:glutathione-regulated potassium-efflux system ancillary protein KefC